MGTRRYANGVPAALLIAMAATAAAFGVAEGVAPAPAVTTPAVTKPAAPPRAVPRATTARAPSARRAAGPAAASDSTLTLKGGQEGTVFRTLTIEGEDRVRLEYDRPELDFDLDPEKAPGLNSGGVREILARGTPDFTQPLVAMSAREPSPFLARPWLGRFAPGAVARFQPDVKGVERWRLRVADSHGDEVASFEGRGDPPREIAWDGSSKSGRPASPGLTYSYVLEASDRAGNRRNFVGPGFKVPAYRVETATGPVLAFSGEDLGAPATRADQAPTPIVLEAASWINHAARPGQRLRVTVTARTLERASTMAATLVSQLGALTLGDPARLHGVPMVQADAPEAGTVTISGESR